MKLEEVMSELESLGKEAIKKRYVSSGAREPLFGVATGAMKPMVKAIKKDRELAEKLYGTGNYDAMYVAGIIADPKAMTEEDFERWIDAAYFYMISDYIVAVTLAETDIAQQVADKWIDSGDELRMSAGWNCYCWLLGSRKDSEFSADKLDGLLKRVEQSIHTAPERAKYAMNQFIYTVAVSYAALHGRAAQTAEAVGSVEVHADGANVKYLNASETIRKDEEKGRIGFKRKYVRC
ncbi:DNA alkylation repair protein [Saccharibacillus sp. CPCC 101409]|uniref:DNA alkylation repair protein n=1 Tax=Saccharibacillus sp. CPCC 101409 TaxID=3058041 RepID=UPI002671959E|nr:DNA alkylation repair protein [Saccharibacillus sp. CPCC 101409]MDO3413016.1 DNA alkylation repair protein [Saccharibacillus sp. CPCC 101409]